jgi:hypothetical protein
MDAAQRRHIGKKRIASAAVKFERADGVPSLVPFVCDSPTHQHVPAPDGSITCVAFGHTIADVAKDWKKKTDAE